MPQHFTPFHPKSETTYVQIHTHTFSLFFLHFPLALASNLCVCIYKCPMFFHTHTLHGIMWNFPVGLHMEIAIFVWPLAIHSFDAFFFFYFSFFCFLLFFTIIFSLMGFLDCCVHTRYAPCTHRYTLVIRRAQTHTHSAHTKWKGKWGYILLELNAQKPTELFIK